MKFNLKQNKQLLAFQKNIDLYPIVGRGHSGGRFACETYIRNGIPMGLVHKARKDSFFFGENHTILKLISDANEYQRSELSRKFKQRNKLLNCVHQYYLEEIRENIPFGWKLGITAFLTPLILDTFSKAKVLHIIRDGRDIMLSRLDIRMPDVYYPEIYIPVNRLTMFGNKEIKDFNGLPLTSETVDRHRNELEMLHWVTAVKYGMMGRKYKHRYLEIRYEDMCLEPIETFSEVFEFLNVTFLESTKEWLKKNARTDRIGKWKTLSDEKMKIPLEIGGELLKELGYI